MGKPKEAAFRDSDGKVVGTGPFHDIGALPLDFRVADEGFLDDAGSFLTREEAAAVVGVDHPVESEEILGKSLKEYEFDDPVPDPSSASQLLLTARHGGKPVGTLTFAAKPVIDENHPYHGYHRIGRADVHPLHRGNGVYGRMLHLASMHVKKKLKSKGLVSPSEWREEAATGAWEKLAAKKPVVAKPGKEGMDFFMSEDESDQKHIEHEFSVEFKRWLAARTEGKPFVPVKPFDFEKAEGELHSLRSEHARKQTQVSELHQQVAAMMHSGDPAETPEFRAAQFLAGGQPPQDEAIRVALVLYDNDFELAALRAYGLPRNEKYREMLRAVVAMSRHVEPEPIKKSQDVEPAAVPRDIQPAVPSAKDTAEQVTRAQSAGAIEAIQLDKKAKHSKGTAVATDPDTNTRWLLKPGSGNLSPCLGVRDELATQSQREAAFYKVADACGVGEFYPKCELLSMDGKLVAALELLGTEFKGFDKLQHEGVDMKALLSSYTENGTTYKWAAIDWICGNPDRHAGNLMTNEDRSEIKLIDHGSAFAGKAFDPAHDTRSFIPFYLRAGSAESFASLDWDEREAQMPKLTQHRSAEFAAWVDSLPEDKIAQILNDYGITPEPTLDRLKELKALPPEHRADAVLGYWSGATPAP